MKKIILAVSAIVILLGAGSFVAQGAGGNNKILKLKDANDLDLGYLVTVASGGGYYLGDRQSSYYIVYDPDLEVFLTYSASDGGPKNVTEINIHYSQPDCAGKAYNVVQFESAPSGQKPDCNNPIGHPTKTFLYRMKTCKLVSATLQSRLMHGSTDCENIPTTSVDDAYLLKSLDTPVTSPLPPFKVTEE